MTDLVPYYLKKRREKAHELLAAHHLSGAIFHQPSEFFHFTGWTPPSYLQPFLVLSSDQMVLVSVESPSGATPVWDQVVAYTVFDLHRRVDAGREAAQAVQEALSQIHLEGTPVGARLDSLSSSLLLQLASFVQLVDSSSYMSSLTLLKDQHAQQEIHKRIAMLDRAFEKVSQILRPGISELEVFSALYASLLDSLGAPFHLDCDIGFGLNTSTPEHPPTSKRLQLDENVLIDLYPNLGGYVADYTRNFVLGKASEEQLQQHAALEQALHAVEQILRPGVPASELDRLARSSLEHAGYGEFIYQHHTGHGFGLTTPEPPWLIPANPVPLQPGMVIAIEPAIYLPDRGGMRLESDYLVTESGFERLDGFTRRLVEV